MAGKFLNYDINNIYMIGDCFGVNKINLFLPKKKKKNCFFILRLMKLQ